MNKLISRNPVQRFKEGRKIEKFQGGGEPEPWAGYYTVGNWPKSRSAKNRTNRAASKASEQAKFNRNYPYDKYATEYMHPSSYFPAFIQDARFGDYVNGWMGETSENQSGLVNDLEAGNLAWQPKTVRVPYVPTQKSQSNSSAQNVDTQNTQSKTTEPQTQSNSNFQNNKSGRTTKPQKTNNSFYQFGKMGGWNNSIGIGNITDPESVKMIKEMGLSGSAKDIQNKINKEFGSNAVKSDNKWGNQSKAGLKALYKKWKENQNVVPEPIVRYPSIINPTYTPPTTPINQEVANLNLNVPQQTYDRTGVREFIRNKGINPYSFSGAQRRALRMMLNNTADDNDKLLVKGMGLFKKGGQLISRNPIERFKNNINKN